MRDEAIIMLAKIMHDMQRLRLVCMSDPNRHDRLRLAIATDPAKDILSAALMAYTNEPEFRP